MLIHNISQLLTFSGGPQRGNELGRLNIVPNGAVLVRGEMIEAVGAADELLAAYPALVAMGAASMFMLATWARNRVGGDYRMAVA